MVSLLGSGVVTDQLIVTLGGGFGRGGDISSGIVLAGRKKYSFDKGVVYVVGFREGDSPERAQLGKYV